MKMNVRQEKTYADLKSAVGGGWNASEMGFQKTWSFLTKEEEMDFVNKIIRLGAQEGYDPELFIKSGKVRVSLLTDDVRGPSASDLNMAHQIDRLLQ